MIQEISERVSLNVPVGELWKFLYDTDRLNRSLGLPTVSYVPDPDSSKKGHFAAEARLGPIPLRYEEFPFEWVQERYYRVKRRFVSGPFLEMVVGVKMAPLSETRSSLELFALVTPRNAFGDFLARFLMRKVAISGVLGQVYAFERGYVDRGRSVIPLKPPPVLGSQLEARLNALSAAPVQAEDVARLRDLIRNGSDVEVARIRPFDLADKWDRPRYETLRFLLHATKAGVLDLNWEIVCPHCRVASSAAPTLSGLASQASCQTCETTFRADFSETVEAAFTINSGIRTTTRDVFCIGAPARSPRILGQFRLEPAEKREERIAFETGRFVTRCYQSSGLRALEVRRDENVAELHVACGTDLAVDANRARAGELRVSLENRLDREALIVIERETWADTAATATAVSSIQEFRDLFPEQAVAPGQEIRVGRLAVLFTDLQGSTELYGVIGDVRAFDFIHAHFNFLSACVSAFRGGLVKTIGDAVMAVFPSSADALSAGIRMQTGWKDFLSGQKLPSFVGLRVGFHEGAAVAFNNKGLLDYFGTTVNVAARVQAKANSDEIVFTAGLLADPDLAVVLEQSGKKPEAFSAELKGISGAQHLVRLTFS